MIRITHDAQKLTSSTTKNIIEDIGSYSHKYAAILMALQSNSDFHCTVYPSTVIQWLKTLASRYPQGTFIFETLDARRALAQKWGVSLPDDARSEEIMASGLLQLDIPQVQPGQDFADLLLAHFYGLLFSAKTFPFTQLPQLFQMVDVERWQANRTNPLLARTFHHRIEEWKDNARSSEQRQLIEWFATDPGELQSLLMRFRILRSYPALGESLLGEIFPVLSSLKLQLDDLAIEEARIPKVVSQVTYTLNARIPKSAEELAALLDQVSGLLWVEYETLERQLQVHPEWISHALVDHLETKFIAFSPRISKPLAKLRSQIRPAKPQAPDTNWAAEQMLDWATHSYLPYQAWSSIQKQFDKELFEIGDKFSSWLMEHWNDIHANSRRMVFNILPKIAAELNTPEQIHLVLVVDNLGWSFSETLRDLFQEKGFYLTGAEPYLAMLPTETEISKKCLLAGAVGYATIDHKNYKGILEKGWLPYTDEKTFRYISDIGKLGQVDALDARVYVVNYLAIDKTLHKSADEIGMPHREHIRHLLEKLVENVADFVEKYNLDDRIRIHVVSDHGSTQIPADVPNDLDPAFFKQSGFEAHSHRFLEVNYERFDSLADNLKLDCFFLPANDFLLPTNMLCARRANRFIPVDKDVFVHGGLLPEEVIVPYMTFEPASVPLKDLDVLLKKNQFRYRLETVELEIGNPNDAAVEQVQVSVLNGNVEWECEPIPLLNGNRNTPLQVTARFKITVLPEEQTHLNLRVRFRARGETHAFDIKLPIVMRKMVEEKSAGIFDD
jgi:hypothetical protein